ncbi:protein of unknown function [Magnetospirillum sp. XM-1]|nr:protein of unknown function [Magnetospirillum sp. XM-1]
MSAICVFLPMRFQLKRWGGLENADERGCHCSRRMQLSPSVVFIPISGAANAIWERIFFGLSRHAILLHGSNHVICKPLTILIKFSGLSRCRVTRHPCP